MKNVSKYYVEVSKASGMKTHFGKDADDERYEPLRNLPDDIGFDTRIEAETHLVAVSEYCNKMGMKVSAIIIVKKE